MAVIRFRATLTRAGATDSLGAELSFSIKPVKPTSEFVSSKLLELLRSVHPEREGDKVTFSKVETGSPLKKAKSSD